MDDAYWGGENPDGKRGRGSENKAPFVAAVESAGKGQPVRMKMHKVKGFRKEEIKNWGQQQLKTDSHVITDGLWAFKGLEDAGIIHKAIVTGAVAAVWKYWLFTGSTPCWVMLNLPCKALIMRFNQNICHAIWQNLNIILIGDLSWILWSSDWFMHLSKLHQYQGVC